MLPQRLVRVLLFLFAPRFPFLTHLLEFSALFLGQDCMNLDFMRCFSTIRSVMIFACSLAMARTFVSSNLPFGRARS